MLYFITSNRNKFSEAQSVIPELSQLEINLPEIQEMDPQIIVKAKLEEARKHHKGELIVEDTSLFCEGLKGLPGPLAKWFQRTIGYGELAKMVQATDNHMAQAKTVIGYCDEAGAIQFFEGVIMGTITEPRGTTTFGWDPIFKPAGSEKSFAEMSAEEKNAVSMRKEAFTNLKNYLQKNKAHAA